MKRRVLIVTQYFWPEAFRVNDLAEALISRGDSVTVLTGIPNYPKGRAFNGYKGYKSYREHIGGVDVIRSPLILRGRGGRIRLALNYFSFAALATLVGLLRISGAFDIIFVFEPSPITVALPAIALKAKLRIPMILWVQDVWPESVTAVGVSPGASLLGAVDRLVSFIYSRCDLILVQSKGFIGSVARRSATSAQIRYFPNTAEAVYKPVTRTETVAEDTLMPGGFRVTFAGNIGAAQDFPTILAAAELLKEHREIKWMVLGDGRMRGWVESEIARRGLGETVFLLGSFPVERMSSFFGASDVMLMTLRKDPILALTIPSKVQSYLACGRPIIAALDGEGARVVAEAGAGLSCPAESPNALAEAVLTLSRKNSNEMDELGRSGRAYFDREFSREFLVDRLSRWMDNLIEGKNCES